MLGHPSAASTESVNNVLWKGLLGPIWYCCNERLVAGMLLQEFSESYFAFEYVGLIDEFQSQSVHVDLHTRNWMRNLIRLPPDSFQARSEDWHRCTNNTTVNQKPFCGVLAKLNNNVAIFKAERREAAERRPMRHGWAIVSLSLCW